MSAPSFHRRGFLRQLAGLPLIGGGVTLIGQPLAVAEPVTEKLMREYADWLVYEHPGVMEELGTDGGRAWQACFGAAFSWHRRHAPIGPIVAPPSTRAALVLSAVGCDWRKDRDPRDVDWSSMAGGDDA